MLPAEPNSVLAVIRPLLATAVAVGGFFIAIGLGWGEYTSRLAGKANQSDLDALQRTVMLQREQADAEKRVTRILLCRLPDIRPDSNCEGYR